MVWPFVWIEHGRLKWAVQRQEDEIGKYGTSCSSAAANGLNMHPIEIGPATGGSIMWIVALICGVSYDYS